MYKNMTLKLSTIICASIFLISIFPVVLANPGYEITVETDQTHYYPDEFVNISGRLTENGVGIEGTISVVVDYPNYQGQGAFLETNASGYYYWLMDLGVDPPLGYYDVEAEYEYVIQNYTSFEVVSKVVEVDAYGPYEGVAGKSVSFFGDAEGGKPPYIWYWDFGDGNNSEEQNPSYTYEKAGEYIVNLTVFDNGSSIAYDETSISIFEPTKLDIDITIKFGMPSLAIKNIGESNAYDVAWILNITGGIFNHIDEHLDGTKESLAPSDEIVVSFPRIFGLGRIDIEVSADAFNVERIAGEGWAFVVLFFIIIPTPPL